MPGVVVRTARADERSTLEALQWRASLANPGDRDALLAHPDAIAIPAAHLTDGHVVLAERDGVILGFATVLPRTDGDAELDALFVDPSHWKQGIGRVLVETCARLARDRGSPVFHVVGNPHAEWFYVSCGFRAAETVQTRFGPAIAMQRTL